MGHISNCVQLCVARPQHTPPREDTGNSTVRCHSPLDTQTAAPPSWWPWAASPAATGPARGSAYPPSTQHNPVTHTISCRLPSCPARGTETRTHTGLETGEYTLRNAEHTKLHHMCASPARVLSSPAYTHWSQYTALHHNKLRSHHRGRTLMRSAVDRCLRHIAISAASPRSRIRSCSFSSSCSLLNDHGDSKQSQ
jgi:hypothetical protein